MYLYLYIIFIYMLSKHTSLSDGCGTVISGPRIVGGEDTGGYHYPWFALLRLRTTGDPPVCAGSLIAPSYVLTAAHCFSSFSGKPKESLFTVALGVYNRCSSSEATRRIFSVVHVDVHEGYSPENKFYDIALMKLEQPSDFPVVCLPIPSASIKSEPGLLVGFGVTKQGNRVLPCRQRQAKVTKYSSTQCADTKLPAEDSHEPTVFCAGGQGIDSCQGDSGGPFLTQNRERNFVVAGIVSYGYGCAKPGLPGIYTNVASYLDWIQTKMAGRDQNWLKLPDKKIVFGSTRTFQASFSENRNQNVKTSISIFPTSPPGIVLSSQNFAQNFLYNQSQHYGTTQILNWAGVSPFPGSRNQFSTTPSSIFPPSAPANIFPS